VMMRSLAVLAMAVVLLWTGTAQATSYLELRYSYCGPTEAAMVWRNTNVYEGNVYTGVYNLDLNPAPGSYCGDEAAALVAQAGAGHIIASFCMDVRQDAPQGTYQRYSIGAPEDAPVGGGNTPMGEAKADDLRRLFGGHWTGNFTNAEAGAFQAAVWEIINETSGDYNVYTGAFHIVETWGSGWGNLANAYLSNLEANALNMQLAALTNELSQDYALTVPGSGGQHNELPVPEPLTAVGMLLGVGCLVRYVRQRSAAWSGFVSRGPYVRV